MERTDLLWHKIHRRDCALPELCQSISQSQRYLSMVEAHHMRPSGLDDQFGKTVFLTFEYKWLLLLLSDWTGPEILPRLIFLEISIG